MAFFITKHDAPNIPGIPALVVAIGFQFKLNQNGDYVCHFAGGSSTVWKAKFKDGRSKWGYFVNDKYAGAVIAQRKPEIESAEEAMGLAAKDIEELVNATLPAYRKAQIAAMKPAIDRMFGDPMDPKAVKKAVERQVWSEGAKALSGTLPWAYVKKKYSKARWPKGRVWSVAGETGLYLANESQATGGIECFAPEHKQKDGWGCILRLRLTTEEELCGILFQE
mgnify:CR=1 FL=1